MIFKFMQQQRADFPVSQMSNVFGVSISGYYAWLKRKPSARTRENEKMLFEIKLAHQESRKTYGSPRIHRDLLRKGIACGRNRIARLMRLNGIRARRRHRKFPKTTQRAAGALAAPNLLNQNFKVFSPNQVWVSDITYIDTAEGWLYLATVMDLFDRQIIGWSLEDHLESSLVESAFKKAVGCRQPAGEWIHHSDQGSQYTSHTFREALAEVGCHPSNSSVGNCYDNAAAESLFSTVKFECAYEQFATRAQARRAIFEYIEVWYNRKRLHSSLGYLSPVEFAQQNSDIFRVHLNG